MPSGASTTLLFGPESNAEITLARPARTLANTDGGSLRIQGGIGAGTGVNGNVSIGALSRTTPTATVTAQQVVLDAGASVSVQGPAITIGTSSSVITLNGTVSFRCLLLFFIFPQVICAALCQFLMLNLLTLCRSTLCKDSNLVAPNWLLMSSPPLPVPMI